MKPVRLDDEGSCGNACAKESVAFLLSRENENDIYVAQALLEPFDLNGEIILADKGYDSDSFVKWIEKRGGIEVIPSRIRAKTSKDIDRHTYKERYLVEKLSLKIKNNRRFATRYEKKACFSMPLLVLPLSLFGCFDCF